MPRQRGPALQRGAGAARLHKVATHAREGVGHRARGQEHAAPRPQALLRKRLEPFFVQGVDRV